MRRQIPWQRIRQEIQRFVALVVGTLVTALAFTIFQEPYNLAAGGVSGIGLIVNAFTGWPIALFYFRLNMDSKVMA